MPARLSILASPSTQRQNRSASVPPTVGVVCEMSSRSSAPTLSTRSVMNMSKSMLSTWCDPSRCRRRAGRGRRVMYVTPSCLGRCSKARWDFMKRRWVCASRSATHVVERPRVHVEPRRDAATSARTAPASRRPATTRCAASTWCRTSAGVLMMMSPSRNANPSHRALSYSTFFTRLGHLAPRIVSRSTRSVGRRRARRPSAASSRCAGRLRRRARGRCRAA